jgi:multidrug resistance efflux pump
LEAQLADDQNSAAETRAEPAHGSRPSSEGNGVASRGAPAQSGSSTANAPTEKPKKSRRPLILTIGAVVVIVAAIFGTLYFINASKYVSTDNAQVDGDKIDINAPTTGSLTDWKLNQGSTVRTNQIVGRIQILGSMAQPQMTIRSPGNGTVAVNSGVEGQYVTAGTELATAYDFNKIYVTARVDETDVADVHSGALVDISVDAYSGTPVTGTVEDVQGSAAGVFSLFPESNSSGNFQKVTQVIPVKIALTNTNGLSLVPGMNVTVYIHKQP